MSRHYLDPKQLEVFHTLANTNSFTLAAKRLFLTQSAVSHSIRALERDLGCQLFDRLGKKAQLTYAGERLLKEMPSVFEALTEARRTVEDAYSWGRGRIRIGASSSTCQYILPDVLREFRECFPECEIIIDPADTPDSLQALQNKEIDLALTLPPNTKDDFRFHPIHEDELRMVLSPSHPIARNKNSTPRNLRDETIILYSRKSHTFEMILSYLQEEGWQLGKTMELGNMQAINDFVRIGLGVSILPSWMVANEPRDAPLVNMPLGKRKLRRQWGITILKGKTLSLIEDTFKGLCLSAYKNLPEWPDSDH